MSLKNRRFLADVTFLYKALNGLCNISIDSYIQGVQPGKLTGCEGDLAINLPGCFRLLFLLSFIRKTRSARLKNPTDLQHKNSMKPLHPY